MLQIIFQWNLQVFFLKKVEKFNFRSFRSFLIASKHGNHAIPRKTFCRKLFKSKKKNDLHVGSCHVFITLHKPFLACSNK